MRILISLALVVATVAGFCQNLTEADRLRFLKLSEVWLCQISERPWMVAQSGSRMDQARGVSTMCESLFTAYKRAWITESSKQKYQELASILVLLVSEYRPELTDLKYDWRKASEQLSMMFLPFECFQMTPELELGYLIFRDFVTWEDYKLLIDQRHIDKMTQHMLPTQSAIFKRHLSYLDSAKLSLSRK